MNKYRLFTLLILLCPMLIQAQGDEAKKGRIYGDLFLNANHNVDLQQTTFRLNRLHFGYNYQFSDKLYFNGMIESARENYEPTGDYNGITNLFEFCVGFKLEKWQGKFGLIGTQLNQQQEQLWKHRYVDKVFADKYGFAPTNDFGAIIMYKPTKAVSFDLAITNGEGHKNAQADSVFRYAAGITLRPASAFVARVYADVIHHPGINHSNIIGILGYEQGKVTAGVEYNQQFNSNYQDDYIRNGVSAYFSYDLTERGQVFGRYDNIQSNTVKGFSEAWNIQNDGALFIGGYQQQLTENLTLALDYRRWVCQEDDYVKSYVFFDVAVFF